MEELFTNVKRLLTNRLHDKAAELCLTNSWNNSITTTKCIQYKIHELSTACFTLSIKCIGI